MTAVPLSSHDIPAPPQKNTADNNISIEPAASVLETSVQSMAAPPAPPKAKPAANNFSSSLSKKITGAHKQPVGKENGKSFRPTIKSTAVDNFWAEKQETAFLNWLNFAFAGVSATTDDHSESLPQKRLLARQRQSIIELYNSDPFAEIVDSVMKEVFERRLQIREDRDINSDVGLRENFVNLLLCYDPTWLKVCLEVVCGDSIHSHYVDKMQKKADLLNSSVCNDSVLETDVSVMSNVKPRIPVPTVSTKGSWKTQVKTFILDKMVDDAIVRQRYTNMTSYTQEKQLKDELSQYTICKFLSLVILLDCAREKELLRGSVLFCRNAAYKSSKEIVIEFCKSFLKGEGDIIRHLSMLGYEVKYTQNYLDEFDYTVSNLATDLRDGVRLSRAAELITKSSDRSLRNILRVPAISRLQKLHNVQQALRFLNCRGGVEVGTTFDVTADSKAIVDGNREGTLLALWKLVYGYEMSTGIDHESVDRESVRIEFYKGFEYTDTCVDVSVAASDPLMPLFQSIARWCRAVIHPKHIMIDNFTSSFTNNQVLCLLINFYRPDLLSADSICFHDMEAEGVDGSVMKSFSRKEVNKMERENFALLTKACHAVGGVPMLLQACDSKNVPEEKTMLYFLTILYKRLLESSEEMVSSAKIQKCFRAFMSRKHSQVYRGKRVKGRRKSTTSAPGAEPRSSILVASRRRQSVSSVVQSKITVSVSKRNVAATTIKSWIMRRRCSWSVGSTCPSSAVIDADAEETDTTTQEVLKQKEVEIHSLREALEKSKAHEAACLQEEERVRAAEALRLQQEMEEQVRAKEERIRLEKLEAQRLVEEARIAQEALNAKLKEDQDRQKEEELRLLREELEKSKAHEAARLQEEERVRAAEALRLQQEMEEQVRAKEERIRLEKLEAQRLVEEARIAQEALNAKLKEEHEKEALERRIILDELEAERRLKVEIEQQKLEEIQLLREMYEKEILHRQAVEAAVVAAEDEKKRLHDEHLRDAEYQEKSAQESLRAALLEREMAEKAYTEGASAAIEAERRARIAVEQQLQEMQAEKEKANLLFLELEAIKQEATKKAQMKQLRIVSAIRVQGFWRQCKCARDFAATKRLATLLQSVARARPARIELRLSIKAAISIQRLVRCVINQRSVALVRNCKALRIQSAVRRFVCRQKYQRLRASIMTHKVNSALSLQHWWKMCLVRKNEATKNLAAVRIQSVFRRHASIQTFGTMSKAILTLQRVYRSYVKRVQAEIGFASRCEEAKRRQVATAVLLRFGAFVVNRIKHVKAVATISSWVIAYRPLLRIRILIKGFTRLQAFYRAYKLRCRSSKAVSKARHQIRVAEEKSRSDPSLRLGHMTRQALHIIKKGKMISQIYKACHTLDTATHFSVKCCGAFTSAGATKALLHLIRSCNRSTPHQEILRLSLSILLNVVRHSDLAVVVAVDFDGTDVVVDLMQMFRDKSIIFNLSCELLGCMVQASEVIKVIVRCITYLQQNDSNIFFHFPEPLQ